CNFSRTLRMLTLNVPWMRTLRHLEQPFWLVLQLVTGRIYRTYSTMSKLVVNLSQTWPKNNASTYVKVGVMQSRRLDFLGKSKIVSDLHCYRKLVKKSL